MEVRYLPCQAHCFSFGGFDLQMIHTLEAVKSVGVKAERLNPWDRNRDFDILHLWGFDISHYRNIIFGKRDRKKIMLTALTGYVSGSMERFKWMMQRQLRSYTYNREMIKLIDSVVVLNEGQAEFAIQNWRVPESKISIIPAIVEQSYFETFTIPDHTFYDTYGVRNFILTTGNVGIRKNQLKLAEACVSINKNLVIIGNALAGEENYCNQLSEFTKRNSCITWIKELKNNSSLLISAYRECDAFALVSHEEQQPISPLEAAVIGKPVLLGNSPYAKQKYFLNACLVDVDDADKIAKAIMNIERSPQHYTIPTDQLNCFQAENVGEQYSHLYQSLLY